MGAGWLYYHKYPPRRKCKQCGGRHYARRLGVMSNGEDVWRVFCPTTGKPSGGHITPYYEES